ncbi:MAG: hypothetical protein J6Y35_02625 [Bacteroidales bacterium]|nr:hypothetical protein [Bacteroidales bacterium]
MKKIVLALLAISATFFFVSCSDFFDDLFGNVKGEATAIINNGTESKFASSIVMQGTNDSVPFYVGLAMNMDVKDLMKIENESQVEYPVFCYRFSGNDINSGVTLTANNTLTEEDLANFRYTDMISGKFADSQVIGIAESDTKFYVMSSGTIQIDKVKKNKISGSYSGSAYVIDRNAEPMLSEEQVTISGTFVSRIVPMMAWINGLQNK